jgi:hypothetical protein
VDYVKQMYNRAHRAMSGIETTVYWRTHNHMPVSRAPDVWWPALTSVVGWTAEALDRHVHEILVHGLGCTL